MSELETLFSHPFFIILSGFITLAMILGFITALYFMIRGVFPVLYRLGVGLSKRKIAIFATDELDDLKKILINSGIFRASNIIPITPNSLEDAEGISLFLVHYKPFKDKIETIIDNKKKGTAIIVYAPKHEGYIDSPILEKINAKRDTTIVNFRGRMLNDILVSMITTAYKK
jgi:hypothetical protein